MDQKWILVMLVFCQKMTPGAAEDKTVKEGQLVEIHCRPQERGYMVVWFRLLDTSGMQFIASFGNTGMLKSASSSFPKTFSQSKIQNDVLILRSFNKTRDGGVYTCASLKDNELRFGVVTRMVAEKVEVAVDEASQDTKQNLCTTATPCVCNSHDKQGETSPQMWCTSIILGPLAGGCGLLLLLLIITTVYCNHIRTRRCPHHYKRKPRVVAPGKQMMTNRQV